ncbi:hypothetical protein GCM10007935_11000 [Hydrogenophaga electricum]|uniref:Uncharacterized protein n=1 Tax=Hydrogenophaga electricum TaxID=1230953 RepID=A0ABQ6C1A2_9BURK|nr:hypothetical protein GCM10007935_11000 [Hydrogenophaga electricum]
MGGMVWYIIRPTTALPAHIRGGTSNRAMVAGVSRALEVMPNCNHLHKPSGVLGMPLPADADGSGFMAASGAMSGCSGLP